MKLVARGTFKAPRILYPSLLSEVPLDKEDRGMSTSSVSVRSESESILAYEELERKTLGADKEAIRTAYVNGAKITAANIGLGQRRAL